MNEWNQWDKWMIWWIDEPDVYNSITISLWNIQLNVCSSQLTHNQTIKYIRKWLNELMSGWIDEYINNGLICMEHSTPDI